MTPELKTACEVVFQEHKLSQQIKWSRDTFRGQISLGLSELAKETLVKKHIIVPSKSKKIITALNPAVFSASSFEEAEKLIVTNSKTPSASLPVEKKIEAVAAKVEQPKSKIETLPTKVQPISTNAVMAKPKVEVSYSPVAAAIVQEAKVEKSKWYLKPVFYYFLWPLLALVGGALISFLIDLLYTKVFLDFK